MEIKNPAIWVRFTALVKAQSVERLSLIVEDSIKKGLKEISVLITSDGGDTRTGLSAAQYLECLPIRLVFYNVGHVHSIGVPLFCAGKERYAVANSRFGFHPSTWTLNGQFDREDLIEKLDLMEKESEDFSAFVCHRTGITPEFLLKLNSTETRLSAAEAKRHGLILDIRSPEIPEGAEILAIA
jgi:ATP-dependent protease ClpP protease subunit